MVASGGSITAIFNSTGSNIITSTIILEDVKNRERSFAEVADVIRDEIVTIPEVINFKVTLGNSPESSNNVDVIVYGNRGKSIMGLLSQWILFDIVDGNTSGVLFFSSE